MHNGGALPKNKNIDFLCGMQKGAKAPVAYCDRDPEPVLPQSTQRTRRNRVIGRSDHRAIWLLWDG
jgi:hypothetical protein